jgi:hypothetical protein
MSQSNRPSAQSDRNIVQAVVGDTRSLVMGVWGARQPNGFVPFLGYYFIETYQIISGAENVTPTVVNRSGRDTVTLTFDSPGITEVEFEYSDASGTQTKILEINIT